MFARQNLSSPEQLPNICRARPKPPPGFNRGQPASRPPLQMANRAKRKIGRRPALPAGKFRASPHIVNQPRRQTCVIRIPPHFAGVTRQRRHQIASLRGIQFHQQIGIRHRPPKFRLDDVALTTGGQGFQRVQNQKMRANVRGMPVVLVRDKNHARTLLRQNLGNDVDRRFPLRRFLFARFKSDLLQTAFLRHDQTKTQQRTGIL